MNIKGYAYAREAIIRAIDDPDMLNLITKKLYPEIAKTFKTTPSRVERAIRHAIEVGCLHGNAERLTEIFGYTTNPNKGKATNLQFIATIADMVRLEAEGGIPLRETS